MNTRPMLIPTLIPIILFLIVLNVLIVLDGGVVCRVQRRHRREVLVPHRDDHFRIKGRGEGGREAAACAQGPCPPNMR